MVTRNLRSRKGLLNLYNQAYKAKNLTTISHCSTKLNHTLSGIEDKDRDPVLAKYIDELEQLDHRCQDLLVTKDDLADKKHIEAVAGSDIPRHLKN